MLDLDPVISRLDFGSRSWKAPERFKEGKCSECHAPLSRYNPNTICNPCLAKLRRHALPHAQPIQIERCWTEYLVRLQRREPIAH